MTPVRFNILILILYQHWLTDGHVYQTTRACNPDSVDWKIIMPESQHSTGYIQVCVSGER